METREQLEQEEEKQKKNFVIEYLRKVDKIPELERPEITKTKDSRGRERWLIQNSDNYEEIDPDWKTTDDAGRTNISVVQTNICVRCGKPLINENGDPRERGVYDHNFFTVCTDCIEEDKNFLESQFREAWGDKHFNFTKRGKAAHVTNIGTRTLRGRENWQREDVILYFNIQYVESRIRVNSDYTLDDVHDIWEPEESLF
jgi:hypothetical protein